jgi:hypothetical protein
VVVSGRFAVVRELFLRDHMLAGLLFAGRVGVRRMLLLIGLQLLRVLPWVGGLLLPGGLL